MDADNPLEFLVGDETHCPYSKVVTAMIKGQVCDELDRKWRAIALGLNTTKSLREQLKTQQALGKLKTDEILDMILIDWRQRCTDNATLSKLVQEVENYEMSEVSENLRKEFNLPEKESNEDGSAEGIFSESEGSKNIVKHLRYYISDLVDQTTLNVKLLQKFEDNGVLRKSQVENLKSIKTEEDKNLKFYLFLIKNVLRNCYVYEELINIFMNNSRNHKDGISCLLNKYFV